MIKFNCLIFFSLFISIFCRSQITFQKNYHDQGIIYSVRQASDSGYIAIGTNYPSVSFFILKTNEAGDTLWTRNFDAGSGLGLSCSENTDGGFIFTGVHSGLFLVRTNTNGDTLWTKEFDSPGQDGGWSALQTQDSGFIISGFTNGTGTDEDICLIKTDSAGDTLWTRAYRASGFHGYGSSVFETADHGFVLAGTLSDKMILIRTNNTGDTLWTKAYGQLNGICFKLRQTSDGGFALLGSGSGRVMMIKTDSIGSPIWSKNYGTLSAEGRFLDQTFDGGYLLVGHTYDSTGTYFGFAIRTDSIGDTLWSRKYSSTDVYTGVRTYDNGYLLGGSSNIQPYSSQLIKTDSNGNTCNLEYYPFTVSTLSNVISQLTITYTSTQFTITNNGFQISRGSNYDVLCSSVAIQELSDSPDKQIIYPNPATDYVVIENSNEMETYQLINSIGQTLKIFTVPKGETLFDIRYIAPGIYFLVSQTVTEKFVKQ